jgi:putative transposase
MIQDIHRATGHPIRRICAVLDLPRSSFYQAATPTPTDLADAQLGNEIEAVFTHHRARYGYRRIGAQLARQGITCAPARIRRIMASRQLKALQPKTYIPRTSDGRADLPSPNLLEGKPLPEAPNRVWAGDITFIPTAAGWLYLAVVIDLCTRRIVGWKLDHHLRSSLVVDALEQALGSRRITPGLIFHSDRGSQYGSKAYRRILEQNGMRQSMSARANPYHNAWTESFMGTLKNEMLHNGRFIDAADAQIEIFSYIESYYNTQRLHSSLNYQTPASYEAEIRSLN